MNYLNYFQLLESIQHGNLKHDKGKHLKPSLKIAEYYSNALYEYEKLIHPRYEIQGVVLKIKVFYNRKNIQLNFETYTTVMPPYNKSWTKVVQGVLWTKLKELGYKTTMVLPVWKDLMTNPGDRASVKILDAKVVIQNTTQIP